MNYLAFQCFTYTYILTGNYFLIDSQRTQGKMANNIPERNDAGKPRKVGYELEFSGLKLQQAAALIQRLYGGEVARKHRYRYEVTGTEFGDFRVELDARALRRMASDNTFKKWGIDFDEQSDSNSLEDIVDRVAQSVVPLEIVMPPVALSRTNDLEKLRQALQQHKAEGTKSSLVHAFGMHINIECPSLQTEVLLNYLRAFLILYPWLLDKHDIDITRKVTPYVDRFPDRYVRLVLDPDYRPDKKRLVADYLHHNPTRNRPLDMMPIWAIDQGDEVQKVLKDEKNAPRPTFHYRLPNSHVDDPNWQMQHELDYWMQVERLANDADWLQKLGRLYVLQVERTLTPFKKNWVETLKILLDLDA